MHGEPRPPAGEDSGETRELRILYQISAALSRSLQLVDLLGDALQTIEGLLNIPLLAVYLLPEQGDARSLKIRARRGFAADAADLLNLDPAAPWHVASFVDIKPFVAREALDQSAGLVNDRLKQEGVQAWTTIPLISRGRVVGILLAASRRLDAFADEQLVLLESIGPDLGVAVENAQLFELVQRGRNEWLSTFDAVEDRIAVFDRDLRVLRANRALINHLGRPPAEIIGKTCRELFPDICAEDCAHRPALDGSRVEREIWTQGRMMRILSYPATGFGVIHVARDVTAEKKREEELIQAEKLAAVNTVLAGIAHELNNPLTVVIAYADLLSRQEQAAGVREEVQLIMRNGLRCQSIVRNLLAFTRADTPQSSEVDVNTLIRDTTPLFGYQVRVSGVRIEERLHPSLPSIVGDRNRLQVLLVNVLNNALQAIARSKRSGYVRITSRLLGDRVSISIEDDGPGIPSENLQRVFEPFFTTKSPGEGTGLGLSLALSIAREHGGDIDITSPPGQGAKVTIQLPVTQVEPRAEPEPPPPIGCLKGRRVLVVDDEPDVRTLVGSALEMFGADVDEAVNGVDALERIDADGGYDAIFTDLRMPEMGGDELVHRLRSSRPELAGRVILTTGDVATPAADEAIRGTGRPFLAKPFNVHELVRSILRVVEPAADSSEPQPR